MQRFPGTPAAFALLLQALLLLGCDDRLPSAPEYQNLWAGRGDILFTQGVSIDSLGSIGTIRTDGSGYTSMKPGLLPAAVRNGKILYILRPNDQWQIFIANRDGSGEQMMSIPSEILLPPSVAFSPDGRHVAYVMYNITTFRFKLYAANADGSGQWLISDRVFEYGIPSFSSTGSRLAFYNQGSGSLMELHVAYLDAGRIDTLARNARPWSMMESLDWSPDGTRLAYVGVENENDQGALRDIFVIDAWGRWRGNITRDGVEDNRWPVWSPNSERIAFIRESEIWVMNADGSGKRQVTYASQWPYQIKMYPQWSPDESMILFTAGTSAVQGVLQVVDLKTLRVNALVTSAWRGFWSE